MSLSKQGTARTRSWLRLPGVLLACLLLASPTPARGEEDWLQFRGPGGRSANTARTPIDFGGEDKRNILWMQETAGRGVASPVVVGSRVMVTGSGGEDERDLDVEAFDTDTGQRLWRRTFHALGRPYTHPTSANAAPTPVSDGESIFALFSSCDLVSLGIDGRLNWYRALAVDHPQTGNDVSMSSSPAVIEGVVLVQLENQGDSFLAGIDARTGRDLWQRPRPRRANWSSPLATTLPDGSNVFVVQSAESIQLIRPRDGEALFEISLAGNSVASPVASGSFLLLPTDGLALLDVRGKSPEILYQSTRLQTRNASHVVAGDRVYACRGSVLVAGRLADGEVLWQQRLNNIRSVWATPVATASGIYVFDQDGNVAIVRDNLNDAEPSSEIIAQLTIPGPVLASPAVVGSAIYVRSENAVYKIMDPAVGGP